MVKVEEVRIQRHNVKGRFLRVHASGGGRRQSTHLEEDAGDIPIEGSAVMTLVLSRRGVG